MVVTVAAVDYGDVAIFVEATAVVVDLSGDTTVDQLVQYWCFVVSGVFIVIAVFRFRFSILFNADGVL